MPRSRAIAYAALAILASGCATRPPPPITRDQANALPPQQLAEIALRQFAGRIRTVTRPNYTPPSMVGMPLQGLTFATAPTSSGFQGLCEASVIGVTFSANLPYPPVGRTAPVRAQNIYTRTAYKIVDEIEWPRAISPEGRERQNRRCAALEHVIEPEQRQLGHRRFFQFDGDLAVAHGAAILQGLLRGVRDGTHTDHRCDGPCPDPAAILRALSLDDLLALAVRRNPTDPRLYTVTATFLESGTADTISMVYLTVEAELDHPLVRRFGQATVSRNAIIRD